MPNPGRRPAQLVVVSSEFTLIMSLMGLQYLIVFNLRDVQVNQLVKGSSSESRTNKSAVSKSVEIQLVEGCNAALRYCYVTLSVCHMLWTCDAVGNTVIPCASGM